MRGERKVTSVTEMTSAAESPASAADPVVRRLRFDVGARPFLVLVELTRACDLACRHCRADSVSVRDPSELTTEELMGMLDDLGALGPPRPRVVLTGGDPLHRPDLEDLLGEDGSCPYVPGRTDRSLRLPPLAHPARGVRARRRNAG